MHCSLSSILQLNIASRPFKVTMFTVEAFKNDHRIQLLEKAKLKKKKAPCDQLLQLINTLVTILLFSILKKKALFSYH